MLFIRYLWAVKYYWVPISLIVVKVWAVLCPPARYLIPLCETLLRLVLYGCRFILLLWLVWFLLLFFLRHSSTSWNWPCIQVSFAIFISVLIFLLISLVFGSFWLASLFLQVSSLVTQIKDLKAFSSGVACQEVRLLCQLLPCWSRWPSSPDQHLHLPT